MKPLKEKIKATTLFSDEDKIAILTVLDSYPGDKVKSLERIIDEFDRMHRDAISEYKTTVSTVLDDIIASVKPEEKKQFQQATSDIRSGVDMLLQ